GAGTITARSDSTSVTQPITIVPLSALTGLVANTGSSTEGANVYANVDIVANAAGGPVYGTSCTWSGLDPSVMMQSQTVGSLESAARSTTRFQLQTPGSFTATCTIGAVATTVQLHR